jgi:hypothetical protein
MLSEEVLEDRSFWNIEKVKRQRLAPILTLLAL